MTDNETGDYKAHGARVHFLRGGTILIKQTVLRNNRYVIDCDARGNHKEGHVGFGSGQAKQVLDILKACQ
jgi:hypothetical protein